MNRSQATIGHFCKSISLLFIQTIALAVVTNNPAGSHEGSSVAPVGNPQPAVYERLLRRFYEPSTRDEAKAEIRQLLSSHFSHSWQRFHQLNEQTWREGGANVTASMDFNVFLHSIVPNPRSIPEQFETALRQLPEVAEAEQVATQMFGALNQNRATHREYNRLIGAYQTEARADKQNGNNNQNLMNAAQALRNFLSPLLHNNGYITEPRGFNPESPSMRVVSQSGNAFLITFSRNALLVTPTDENVIHAKNPSRQLSLSVDQVLTPASRVAMGMQTDQRITLSAPTLMQTFQFGQKSMPDPVWNNGSSVDQYTDFFSRVLPARWPVGDRMGGTFYNRDAFVRELRSQLLSWSK